jgi:hypothetical protein
MCFYGVDTAIFGVNRDGSAAGFSGVVNTGNVVAGLADPVFLHSDNGSRLHLVATSTDDHVGQQGRESQAAGVHYCACRHRGAADCGAV